MPKKEYDAIVVGSGPNGLSAAIVLAKAGLSVAVFEGRKTLGGGARTEELTLPGFLHDTCSAIHPLAFGSPFFKELPLSDYGLEWIHPNISLAHPFDNGKEALLTLSIEDTIQTLGNDGNAYKKLITPCVKNWKLIEKTILGPLKFPKHPLAALRFARFAFRSASSVANTTFKEEEAKALFAGLAAHSILPLDSSPSAAFGLVLATFGHLFGWPMPKGGAQTITDALCGYFQHLNGKIFTGCQIKTLEELPSASAILLDVTPKQVLELAGHSLPEKYKQQLQKYRYGPGVFKIDWALHCPIPWKSKNCRQAGTVHLGGTFEEIVKSEALVWQGKISKKPFVLLAQQSLFDPSRAPFGKHTAWAYCHVPHSSLIDMTQHIESQVERFAPGFYDCILAKSTKNTFEMERQNPNCIGGDITGGVQDLRQLFFRPTTKLKPYSTPLPRLFICSSSTPPGGGVHGMCGYHAATLALKDVFALNFHL